MAALNSKLLKDTQDLVRFYNTNNDFRELFNRLLPVRGVTYQKRPLKFYIKFLTTFSPKYKPYYSWFLNSKEMASELLTNFYKDPREYPKLTHAVRQASLGEEMLLWSQDEHRQIEHIDAIPDDKKRESAFESFLSKKDNEEGVKPELITSPITPNTLIPQPVLEKSNSSLKNISSKAQILIKKFGTTYSSQLLTIGSGGLGAVLGGITLGPTGALAGATGGFLIPAFFRRGGGEMMLKGGLNMADAGIRTFNTLGRVAMFLPVGRVVIAVFLAIFILPIFLGLLKSSAPFSPIDVAESAPIDTPGGGGTTPGGGGGDIAQCKFTRSGDGPGNERSFVSPLLLSYFQEASNISGIPAALLAAFVRVESGITTSYSDQDILNYTCNASNTSSSGALGVMQIQPRGTTGYAEDAVNNGASYIGKTAATITREDYCNVRKNILIGTGFIIAKMRALGYSNTGKWNPAWTNDKNALDALAEGYYGCHKYPNCEDKNNQGGGPFDYGQDLYTSVQACKPITPSIAPPPEGDLRLAIKQNFNLDFQDTSFASPGMRFTDRELNWAWEALSEAKNKSPKFFNLMSNAVNTKSQKYVLVMHSSSSAETFNPEDPIRVNIRDTSGGPFAEKQLFKQILIHELGHIVHGTSGGARDPRYDSGLREAQQTDQKKLTCYSDVNIDESFSEIVSYYLLNSLPSEQRTSSCALFWPSVHPLKTNLYPAHLRFIESILK